MQEAVINTQTQLTLLMKTMSDMPIDFHKISAVCKEIGEMGDQDFLVCLGLIGFKRIMKAVTDYGKNYGVV